MAKQVKVKTVSNLSNNAFLGLLFIILGIFFIMGAQNMMNILFTILGAVLIVLGATELFDKNWVVGAIELALGIVVIVCGNVILSYMTLILGIAILVYAVFLLVMAIINSKKSGAAYIVLSLISPIILLTVGILLILAYCGVGSVGNLFIAIGALSIAVGAFLVFYELIRKAVRKSK